jgi:internalin A
MTGMAMVGAYGPEPGGPGQYVSQDGTRAVLHGLGLTIVPDWLRELSDLTHLDLSRNRLTVVPDWLGDLTSLTFLNVRGNELTTVPNSLGQLRSLNALDFSRNKLTAMPEWLGEQFSLTSLRVAGNQLAKNVEAISLPASLTYLDVAGNRFRSLPGSLRHLRMLSHLDLEDNELRVLPEWIGEMTALNEVRVRGNELADLPMSMAMLSNLTSLYASVNNFAELAPSLRDLVMLKKLFLNGNRLTELPDWLGELTGLTHLYLSRNNLVRLPDSLGGLTGLEHLSLSDNQLTDLPDCLAQLASLELITLAGNPLPSPLAEIAQEGSSAVRSFLGLISTAAQEQWWSKLIVAGEGGAGKTSLVKVLNNLPYDPNEPTTHGTEISQISLEHPRRSGVLMRLSSWDFGGQDIYHATHQFFLSDRSLFLLLWNARHGWEHAKLPYWLDIVKARAPAARVILVATHASDRPTDLPLIDLKRDYPQIVASAGVDNATGLGIDRLRRLMADVAADLPLMGSRWPASWLAGAEKIRTSREKYSTPEALHSQLVQHGIPDLINQTHLLRALHLLGDILYYDDDDELRDTVILHPQWVTTYISKVLDSPEVAEQSGLLTRRQVQVLWHDLDVGLRDRFLRMMEKFDLSYRIPDSPEACLVVERLPWESPAYQPAWQEAADHPGTREIAIRYHLSTIPPGVPTWFIAREHRFTTGLHWRSGALLRSTADPRVLGLIRADRHNRTIDLAARGPAPQLFFSTLQDGFESTLRRYQGLEIDRHVRCICNGAGQPCMHTYRYDDLLRRLEATPPRLHVECPRSLSLVSVTALLFGLAASTGDQILARLEDIDRSVTDFRAEAAWTQRDFLKILRRNQLMFEAQCPSIFTLTEAARKPTDLPGKRRFELRLYCEHPGNFHPLTGNGYAFERPAEWLTKISPYLNMLLTVLKHAAPLVAPVFGLVTPDLDARFQRETALMQALVDQMPDRAVRDGKSAELLESAIRSDVELDSDYRAIYALLDTLDPAHHWAGLNRIRTPEDQILWLCREHALHYL